MAVRVLEQLAYDHKEQYPTASKILLEDFYVDDVFTGSSNENELIAIRNELLELMSHAKLKLDNSSFASVSKICEYQIQERVPDANATKTAEHLTNPNRNPIRHSEDSFCNHDGFCDVRRDHVKKLWETIESEYDKCSQVLQQEASSSGEWQAIEAKYDYCYSVYERCVAQLTEVIERMLTLTTLTRASSTAQLSISSGCRLPPCDTEVFRGNYLRWPTFRDLFTAIYVNNPRLTPVEKLFHLITKTEGEAKAIVAKSPLTHDGFESAWTALCDRFENKRLLVNSQLKILFNLPVVVVESGAALKELQSTIQGCFTALEHSKISIDNWDCLLVFLCSSKLPKLTLSLWQQSLSNKCEIPAWHEMNSFLSERYRTLEAIEDVKPSSSIKMVNSQPPSKNTGSKRINSFETNVTQGPKNCDLCAKENHPVRVCPRFLQMPVSERSAYIRRKKLCLNCFAGGHQLKECTSKHNCFTCKGRHNTLLHRADLPQLTTIQSNNNPTTSTIQ
ncbi:uncharacterized protein LOC123258154 [Drosophila ananassae]|uniref:uncharacterized protein LOC123258154 n=1 Tax=Drosophila ananassae TaxID=7217 RepID=UPI001CFFAFD1|nr:uncharacterized protein LOC123258154 [Drosophila ananassae]